MDKYEIRDDEILVDKRTGPDWIKSSFSKVRYYTLNGRTLMLAIAFTCISVWAGIFALGVGVGGSLGQYVCSSR